MNKNKKGRLLFYRTLMFVLAFCLYGLLLPVTAQAAKKPKLSKTKISLETGKSVTLKLSGATKGAKWSVSDSEVLTLKKVTKKKYKVTARSAGTAKVTVKAGKKKAVCKVTVKEPAIGERKLIFSGDENLDYLLKLMLEDTGVKASMSDEEIAYKIFRWMARNCVYEYEGEMKYGSKAKSKYPPYGLKMIYDLSGKEDEIAAYKKECDAREAAGEISYDMLHVKSGGRRLYVRDNDHPYSTLECYQRLTGTCSYMASIYTNLCEMMGLKGGINIGEIYSSSKGGFTEHYISFIYLNGKKYYVDPGSAVHTYTRRGKYNDSFFKLSKSFIKKNYRLGNGYDEY